jgi:hypothetical protein
MVLDGLTGLVPLDSRDGGETPHYRRRSKSVSFFWRKLPWQFPRSPICTATPRPSASQFS